LRKRDQETAYGEDFGDFDFELDIVDGRLRVRIESDQETAYGEDFGDFDFELGIVDGGLRVRIESDQETAYGVEPHLAIKWKTANLAG
jgi:hypothetical protein